MCRMFSVISSGKDISSEALYFLRESEKSLLAQACGDSKRPQKDGWGTAFFKAGMLSIKKSPMPASANKGKEILSFSASGNVFMAHIRDASNPRRLPYKKLISMENTQPFSGRGLAFCHNGTLCIPDAVAENLGSLKKNIKGLNDSEVLFWQIIKSLEAYGDPITALKMAVDEIETVWISVKKSYASKGINVPYRGLNIILAYPDSIYAMCLYGPQSVKKEAILTPGWPWGNLAYRMENDFFVISSEPLDSAGWLSLYSGELLSVTKNKGQLKLRKDKI
ncbi:MAG: hypothetical protein Fur0012_06230 [Elusimicrobiota bacterium]